MARLLIALATLLLSCPAVVPSQPSRRFALSAVLRFSLSASRSCALSAILQFTCASFTIAVHPARVALSLPSPGAVNVRVRLPPGGDRPGQPQRNRQLPDRAKPHVVPGHPDADRFSPTANEVRLQGRDPAHPLHWLAHVSGRPHCPQDGLTPLAGARARARGVRAESAGGVRGCAYARISVCTHVRARVGCMGACKGCVPSQRGRAARSLRHSKRLWRASKTATRCLPTRTPNAHAQPCVCACARPSTCPPARMHARAHKMCVHGMTSACMLCWPMPAHLLKGDHLPRGRSLR